MAALDAHPTITEHEYISKLRVWKESTSTSPSGLHLEHYKALIARHAYSDIDNAEDELRAEWNNMQSCLLTLHVQMLNYALERGYSYIRWHTVVNTILFKDLDNVRIHRTRVIHIYEADYNLTLGIKWRMALYQADYVSSTKDNMDLGHEEMQSIQYLLRRFNLRYRGHRGKCSYRQITTQLRVTTELSLTWPC